MWVLAGFKILVFTIDVKYIRINIMGKSKNTYTPISLMLTTVGTLLITQNLPFYLDIAILCVALVIGFIGYKKGEK